MERLGQYITPNQLYLTLHIKAHTQNDVEAILRPFVKHFPTLRECAIHMCAYGSPYEDYKSRDDLQSLAERTSHKLLNKPGSIQSFPFMRQPFELRQLVLEEACLLSQPSDTEDASRLVFFEGFMLLSYKCCGKGSDRPAHSCYCRTQRGSYSSSCVCSTPGALLRINQQLYHEVREAFYVKNMFCLAGETEEIHKYLRTIPPRLLSRIRKLELIIAYPGDQMLSWYGETSSDDLHPLGDLALKYDWCSVLRFIAHNLNLGNLELYLKLPRAFHSWYMDLEHPSHMFERSKVSHTQHRAILAMLPKFSKLKGLFAYTSGHPFSSAVTMGRQIEKMVMGNTYDSNKEGKPGWLFQESVIEGRNGYRTRYLDELRL